MRSAEIKNDAEDVHVVKNHLVSIGGKIINKLPKYQYMGIIKFKKTDFLKLKIFFKKFKNKQIDLTSFLDQAIRLNIIKINVVTTSKFWYEIDTAKDLEFVKKKLW
jgi:choline kinase